MIEVPVKILITGSNGQLGQKLVLHCVQHRLDFLATAQSSNQFSGCPDANFKAMDVTNSEQVQEIVSEYKPSHIINTAALTNVDACETEIESCYAVNKTAVQNILKAIQNTTIHFIQISTDFIFDGEKKLYSEEDIANPLGEYGKSKWEGEKVLLESNYPYYTILRTSLVYGVGESLTKSNIFNWAMTQLREDKEITIVNDQFRTPTYVEDLAQACFKAIEHKGYGVFNIAGETLHSMYEFILLVADYLKKDRQLVQPISTSELKQKAPRPQSSGLIIGKAKKELDYQPTDFLETLSKIDLN